MRLVTNDELYAFLGEIPTTDLYANIRDSVEEWVRSFCNRTFGSTSYKERYDGTGSSKLVLRQYPVVSVERLSLWSVPAIRIRCSGSTTHAVVSVTSTGLVLRKDGVSNTTVLFATYTTLAAVVTAVNAISGWEANIQDPAFSTYLSTELIERMGLFCKGTNWAYLEVPDDAEADFDVDSERGIIILYRWGGGLSSRFYGVNVSGYHGIYSGTALDELTGAVFPRGTRNVFVDYTAGYAIVPKDLLLAIKIMCKTIIQKNDQDSFNLASYSVGDVSMSFKQNEFPETVVDILGRYKIMNI